MASIVFIAVVAVVLLVLQPFPVLHDYPEWMYQGHIAYSLLTDVPKYTGHYEFVNIPVPNAISQAAIALLNYIATPVMAGKIWLAAYLLLAVYVAMLVGHRRGGAMQLIFVVCIALGSGYWNGYINFQFGLLFFAMYALADQSKRSAWQVLVFSLLIYFSHASVFAAFVLYVVACELTTQRRASALLALVPTLALMLWYAVFKLLAESGYNTSVGTLQQWVQYKAYTMAKLGPFQNFILADGHSLLTDFHVLYMVGFALNFLVAGLIGVWLLVVGWKLVQRKVLTENAEVGSFGLLITVFALLLLWLLAGKNSFGVVNLGERFLVVVIMLLMLNLVCPKWISNSWSLVCVGLGVVTLGSLLVLSQSTDSYAVARSADNTELENYVDDIYRNSRHKYFNHRLFIYANLGQYLGNTSQLDIPPPIDHESSIVRMVKSESAQ